MKQQYSITSTDVLNPLPGNPRIHSDKQIDQIATAITQFDVFNPIVIDSQNRIIAGEGRFATANLTSGQIIGIIASLIVLLIAIIVLVAKWRSVLKLKSMLGKFAVVAYDDSI